ncbi:leukocyte antigen CD37 isoform 5-T5 [Cyanocitta cristata]
MSPKSCLGCTKFFLFLLNLLFFFLGILLLTFSFWVLFDRQSFAAVLGSPLASLRLWSYGFSGVGIVTMLLGFLGCLGALKEVKVMLGLYFGILLLLFAAQITVAIIAYTQRAALATKVATYAEELIRGYPTQGPPGDPHESWDAVQHSAAVAGKDPRTGTTTMTPPGTAPGMRTGPSRTGPSPAPASGHPTAPARPHGCSLTATAPWPPRRTSSPGFPC